MSEERSERVRQFGGTAGWVLATIAVAWVLFHVVTAGLGTLPNFQQRAVHLGGALALAFIFFQGSRRDTPFLLALDCLLAVVSLVALGYVFINYETIVQSTWFINEPVDRVLGILLFLIILEAVRRTLGWMFVGLIAFFVLYAYFGPYFPGQLGHRGINFDRLVYSFYLGGSGILGTLMGISATVVALFLILGALLNTSGGGDTFIRIAMRIGGRMRGGAGIVAVIGSAFMGMINGSTVANVTSTGVLTIPLMRRLGFRRNLAGAIEAVASTGGQIMPPIMGPGAFLMAELLGISYLTVVTAALVPSLLFFSALLLGVYLLALRYDLAPLPPEFIPTARDAFAPFMLANLVVPIGTLVYFIVNHYTIQLAVFWAIVAVAGTATVTALLQRGPVESDATRKARESVGLAADEGPAASPEATGAAEDKDAAARLAGLARSFGAGLFRVSRSIVYIAMIIAAAQIIVSLINLTGLGVTFSQVIVAVGTDRLILSLVLTMLIAIVLGMGMPTPAAYAVGAAVLGPPLINLGFETLPAHLFLYFFASVSAITPPVAAGIFAAIAISGGTFLGTARHAMVLACSLFLIPYMFIMNPELTLRGDLVSIIPALITAAVGIVFISFAAIGQVRRPVGVVPRLLMAAGAFTLIVPDLVTDLIGAAVALLGLLLHLKGSVVIKLMFRG
jgi:TRAP transporter 4TM/12TM fusion protein